MLGETHVEMRREKKNTAARSPHSIPRPGRINQCLGMIHLPSLPHHTTSLQFSVVIPRVIVNNTPNTSLPNLIPCLALATPSAKNDLHRALPAADGFVFARLVRAVFVNWRSQEGYAGRELVRPGQAEGWGFESVVWVRVWIVAPAGEEALLVIEGERVWG
jgi:hypothetical protein